MAIKTIILLRLDFIFVIKKVLDLVKPVFLLYLKFVFIFHTIKMPRFILIDAHFRVNWY